MKRKFKQIDDSIFGSDVITKEDLEEELKNLVEEEKYEEAIIIKRMIDNGE